MSQKLRRQYSNSDVIAALDAVKNGLSLRKAAVQYGVPQATLCDKRKQKYCVGKVRPGPASKLGQEQEQRLVAYLQHMAVIGHEIARKDVPAIVKTILDSNTCQAGTATDDHFVNCNMPSIGWVCRFFSRFPELDAWMPANHCRQKAPATETTIRQWFDRLAFFCKVHYNINVTDFLSDANANQIFSVRENTFSLVVSNELCFNQTKGKKNTDKSSLSAETQVTVLCCGGADGRLPKPFVVFPTDQCTSDTTYSNPLDLDVVSTPNDLTSPDFFSQWLTSSFFPSVKGKVSSPVLLFVDCPSLLISLAVYEFCNENDIILFCLPHHASHVMQPLEMSVFKSLQTIWNDTLLSFEEDHGDIAMSKAQFIPFFRIAWQKAEIKSQKIKQGFQATGLVPFNPDAVSYSQLTGERVPVPQKKFLVSSQEINSRKEKLGMTKMFNVFEDCMTDDMKALFKKRFTEGYDSMDTESDLGILWQFYKQGKQLVGDGSSNLVQNTEIFKRENVANNTVDSTIKTDELQSAELDGELAEITYDKHTKDSESIPLIVDSACSCESVTTSGRQSPLSSTTNFFNPSLSVAHAADKGISIVTQFTDDKNDSFVYGTTTINSLTGTAHVHKTPKLEKIIERQHSRVQKKRKQKEYFAYMCKQAYKAQKLKKRFARLKTQEQCKLTEYHALVSKNQTNAAHSPTNSLDRRKEEELLKQINLLQNITKHMIETDDSSTCSEDNEIT